MRLAELERCLSQCEVFEKPKVSLEQYATSAHIAARMLYSAQDYINQGIVCDLGSGCGILSIGSVMLEASLVYGFEIDGDAIEIARSNVQDTIDEDDTCCPLQFIQCEVETDFSEGGQPPKDLLTSFDSFFDVVIMNPPFGTKNNAGADFGFLQRAFQLCRAGGHIYSLHKTSTRPFFQKKISSSSSLSTELGYQVTGEVLAAVRYDLPKAYKFHKHKSVDIEVDFWHFQKSPPSATACND